MDDLKNTTLSKRFFFFFLKSQQVKKAQGSCAPSPHSPEQGAPRPGLPPQPPAHLAPALRAGPETAMTWDPTHAGAGPSRVGSGWSRNSRLPAGQGRGPGTHYHRDGQIERQAQRDAAAPGSDRLLLKNQSAEPGDPAPAAPPRQYGTFPLWQEVAETVTEVCYEMYFKL